MSKEIPREKFVELVKSRGKVRAMMSHSQEHPTPISQWAILDWQYDGKLFAITRCGNRVEASEDMPAFHEVEVGNSTGEETLR